MNQQITGGLSDPKTPDNKKSNLKVEQAQLGKIDAAVQSQISAHSLLLYFVILHF